MTTPVGPSERALAPRDHGGLTRWRAVILELHALIGNNNLQGIHRVDDSR